MGELKLFVWHDVLCDYTCGVMFALAHDVDEAREAVLAHSELQGMRVTQDINKEPKVYDTPAGFAVWGGG